MQDKHIGRCVPKWQEYVVHILLYQLCGKWESFEKTREEYVLQKRLANDRLKLMTASSESNRMQKLGYNKITQVARSAFTFCVIKSVSFPNTCHCWKLWDVSRHFQVLLVSVVSDNLRLHAQTCYPGCWQSLTAPRVLRRDRDKQCAVWKPSAHMEGADSELWRHEHQVAEQPAFFADWRLW